MKTTKYLLFVILYILLGCTKVALINPISPITPPKTPTTTTPKTLTEVFSWGDSLTFGLGGDGTSYPSALQQMIGGAVKVKNEGVSGNTSEQIAARMVDSSQYYSYPVIIWAGRNNFRDTTQVRADIATMVSKLNHKDYLVLSITNGQYALELKGASDYVIINRLNASLAKIYGSHYVDVRSYLVSQYNPNNAQDVIDHNNDIPPLSLRSDEQHLNAAGYTDVAKKIYQSIAVLKQ